MCVRRFNLSRCLSVCVSSQICSEEEEEEEEEEEGGGGQLQQDE